MPPLDTPPRQSPPPHIPVTPPVSPATPPAVPKKKAAGPTVGIIIIVILFIFGGLYFWGAKLNSADQHQPLPFIPGDATSTN